jgi:signal transduction histidine kinase
MIVPLSHESQRSDAYLSLLDRVSNLVSSSLETEEVFVQLLDTLVSGLKVDACWIQLLNSEKQRLTLVAHRGFTTEMAKEISSLKLGQGLIGKVALTGQLLMGPDVAADPNFVLVTPIQAGFRSFMAVPMRCGGKILGVLGLYDRTPNRFTEYEGKLLSAISACVAVAVDRAFPLHGGETEKARLISNISEKQEFLSALSHELQTPLTALIASAGLLAEELEKEPSNSRFRLIQNVLHSASNLQNRLAELLDLSQAKTAHFRIRRKAVDFSALARKVAEEFSPLMKEKGQSLVMKVPATVIVTADEQRLEQILLNLISNAIKFTPRGGQITFMAKEDKADLIVEVQDTGPGIPREEQLKLFRPYYRVPADRHRFPGLGLGLAITKQLVELHSGKIWVESEPGKGSTFAFSLPLVSSKAK